MTTRAELEELACAAVRAANAERYGLPVVDEAYVGSLSDDKLRAIVRAWFHTDDVDALLAPGPRFAA